MSIRSGTRLMRWVFMLITFWVIPGAAAEDGEAFIVESVNSNQRERVIYVSAVFRVELPPYITRAVEQGFELPLVLEVEIFRKRSYWFDAQEHYIRQEYRINHESLLDSVSVLEVNSGLRRLYPTLREAIESMTVILDQPMLDAGNLSEDEEFEGRLRLGIDQGSLPLPLKSSSLWENDWTLMSDWREWEIAP